MNTSPAFAQANWIASTTAGGARTCAPAPYFRRAFSIPQPVRSASLSVSALGLYECEINGTRIGDEIFAPGWTEYRKRVAFQTYDVTAQLHPGENVLGAILGDGWYCGYLAWGPRQTYGDRPRLLAQLDVMLEDGSSFSISTDTTWKTATGPILENDHLVGESYDARLEFGAWSQAGFDDSHWQSAILLAPESPIAVEPRVGPPVRRMGEIKPISTISRHSNTHLFDLGQNFTGRVRISAKATRGTTVQIKFAEILNPDGSLYTENLRGARATDYYTCKSSEIETWEPRFTFHGFRHVEVYSITPLESVEITGIVLHSDTPPTGTFRCSSDLLNQLQHNIVWGQKSNFLEAPTDCPQRDERLGWTGDAQIFIRTAAFNMDVQGFFQKWIRDVRDAQGPKGSVPCVVPFVPNMGAAGEDGGPAWADAAIICPWTVYLCYADRQILADHFDSMRRFMDFIAGHRCKGLIRSHPDVDPWGGFGDWLALDGGGKREGITPRDLIGTAYYAYDAEIMANVATILGRDDDGKHFRELHTQVVEAFRRRFITPDGLVVSGTQTAYVLALRFGLVPDDLKKNAARELVRDIEARGFHLATGFVGTPYLLDVLEESGYLDLAYRLLEQETFPSWLFPVKNGATTIWERWDGWTADKGVQDKGMNSFNHYAYGAVGDWMVHTVAGLELDPHEPAYRHIRFRPRPGGSITWAEARLKTASGIVGIRWDLEGNRGDLKLDLTVPADCYATLEPPHGYAYDGERFGPGQHELVLSKNAA